MIKTKYEKRLIFLVCLFVLFTGIWFASNLIDERKIKTLNIKAQAVAIDKERTILKKILDIQSTLDNTPVLASSVSVYDVTLGRKIYGKNDTTLMPLASLVKTATVLVALEGQSEDSDIKISHTALRQEGDYGLEVGQAWKQRDLAQFALNTSSNDAAFALAESDPLFMEKMKELAKKIGMNGATFLNTTGLDQNNNAGALGSAEDANKLAIFAYHQYPEVFSSTTLSQVKLTSLDGKVYDVKNTNVFLPKLPNVLFSKTGFTNLAGGNLSIIFKNAHNHEIAVTVLRSTMEGRFSDMEKIVNLLYNFNYEN